jgi:hypothetical protein
VVRQDIILDLGSNAKNAVGLGLGTRRAELARAVTVEETILAQSVALVLTIGLLYAVVIEGPHLSILAAMGCWPASPPVAMRWRYSSAGGAMPSSARLFRLEVDG